MELLIGEYPLDVIIDEFRVLPVFSKKILTRRNIMVIS
jgi:hypothetical protein